MSDDRYAVFQDGKQLNKQSLTREAAMAKFEEVRQKTAHAPTIVRYDQEKKGETEAR